MLIHLSDSIVQMNTNIYLRNCWTFYEKLRWVARRVRKSTGLVFNWPVTSGEWKLCPIVWACASIWWDTLLNVIGSRAGKPHGFCCVHVNGNLIFYSNSFAFFVILNLTWVRPRTRCQHVFLCTNIVLKLNTDRKSWWNFSLI